MVFCSSCGKELNPDEKYCTGCGKPMKSEQTPSIQTYRPTGITILGILQIISGAVMVILAVFFGAISGSMGNMMYDIMGGAIGGILSAIFGILAAISFLIAWGLFSAKRWGRTVVIVLSIIDLVLEAVSLAAGNAFGIALIILDLAILYYMWRPHVIAYFNK